MSIDAAILNPGESEELFLRLLKREAPITSAITYLLSSVLQLHTPEMCLKFGLTAKPDRQHITVHGSKKMREKFHLPEPAASLSCNFS